MPPEAKKWVKPTRQGRHRGCQVSIDQDSWEHMLRAQGIPVSTPLDQLRVTRYPTKMGTVILKVKKLADIKPGELEGTVAVR